MSSAADQCGVPLKGLAWRTVKDMDRAHLKTTLPVLHPRDIVGVRLLGVDEVACAKGHDDVTVVYDLESGALLWVGDGRTADTLSQFLAELSADTAAGIQAVAIDMSAAFAKAVREQLPQASIVHDRFHVMQLYSKALDQVRRREFKRASPDHQDLIRGTRYLLLRNRDDLCEAQAQHLDRLLQANQGLQAAYVLKSSFRPSGIHPRKSLTCASAGDLVRSGPGQRLALAAAIRQDAPAAQRRYLQLHPFPDHDRSGRSWQCRHRHDS